MNEGRHGCPVCRTESKLVIPSAVFATGKQKNEIRATYMTRLSSIPCKLFNQGKGYCRWAPDCNYAHLNEDGSLAVNGEGLQHSGNRRRPTRGGRNGRGSEPSEPAPTREEMQEFIMLAAAGLAEPDRDTLELYLTLSRLGLSRSAIVAALSDFQRLNALTEVDSDSDLDSDDEDY